MRIALLGVTGATGVAVARVASELGHEITALSATVYVVDDPRVASV